ncbi:MAG TPA: M48 family metallopeptidase [Steroidobacteraceae bacterium]|nr:M48 family metallopeptidase [Steroidobacteraceae bacterium]
MRWITELFVLAMAGGVCLRLWLSVRQVRAVTAHRNQVPEAFADRISLPEHRKAADYTVANALLGRTSLAVDSLVTLALTLGGGLAAIDALWARAGWPALWTGAAVILTVACLTALVDLPLSAWRTFKVEAAFGFNRMTPRLFFADLAKSAALAVLIGGPVVLGALLVMDRAGRFWWLWAWCGWVGLTLLMTWAWPAFIAPLFHRFSSLEDPALRGRIESLLQRCGFTSQGIFVIDGSRRSSHGNAYFTGIGRNKRIVFFDTLLASLTHPEVEAVLAHELGHFRLRHVRKRLLVTMGGSFAALALLGWLAAQPGFYAALGVTVPSSHAALLLFALAAPVFLFFATPLGALWSRAHEFAADAFAARHASAGELAIALVKLYRDNATTLTPDVLYSRFYYSHPPAVERIRRLRELASPGTSEPAAAAPAAS